MDKLELIIKESKLEKTKADYILEKFKDYFSIASEWEKKAKTIKVVNENQIADMKMARIGRLELRQKRIDVENSRKKLKEDCIREGKTIEGIANVLKGLIIPIEKYLDNQEHFIENKQKAEAELKKLEHIKEIEAEKIEMERLEAERLKKQRIENVKMKKEIEMREIARIEREQQIEIERKKQAEKLEEQRIESERKQKEIEEIARIEREQIEKEKIEKLEIERIKNEKIEQEKKKLEKKLAEMIECPFCHKKFNKN